jgi:hypothetical protein
MNFCDSPLYSPVKRWTRAGPIRARRAMEVINVYLLSFFQVHVNGAAEHHFDALSPRYPEVEMERLSTPGR